MNERYVVVTAPFWKNSSTGDDAKGAAVNEAKQLARAHPDKSFYVARVETVVVKESRMQVREL